VQLLRRRGRSDSRRVALSGCSKPAMFSSRSVSAALVFMGLLVGAQQERAAFIRIAGEPVFLLGPKKSDLQRKQALPLAFRRAARLKITGFIFNSRT
jgi:hypothetical protein